MILLPENVFQLLTDGQVDIAMKKGQEGLIFGSFMRLSDVTWQKPGPPQHTAVWD